VSCSPSAAAFASPQPFARRHNPFAAPSFCAPPSPSSRSRGGHGEGGEGLFAVGADFLDLLADLDAIEQVTTTQKPFPWQYSHVTLNQRSRIKARTNTTAWTVPYGTAHPRLPRRCQRRRG
jgi:hypothetical protein